MYLCTCKIYEDTLAVYFRLLFRYLYYKIIYNRNIYKHDRIKSIITVKKKKTQY